MVNMFHIVVTILVIELNIVCGYVIVEILVWITRRDNPQSVIDTMIYTTSLYK